MFRKSYTTTILLLTAISLNAASFASQKTFASQNRSASQKKVVTLDRYFPETAEDEREQIIRHYGYTVSYNADRMIPNWVIYELTPKKAAGEVPRAKRFVPDPLAEGNVATHGDYTNSGYDRGHMAPAGDMKWSERAMKESFYLSNVCPQDHNLNGGDWRELEEKVRSMALSGDTIYVICGPVTSDNPEKIGSGVHVPEAFFKILFKRDKGSIAAIAFVMLNAPGDRKLSYYAVTVRDVELLTGADFFASLPRREQNKIEKACDTDFWGIK